MRIIIPHPKTLTCAWPLGCKRMANGYDHDHETGRVRSALCSHHNAVLRSAGDTSVSLRTVADWLENADMGFSYNEAYLARKRVANAKWEAANIDTRSARNAANYRRRKHG